MSKKTNSMKYFIVVVSLLIFSGLYFANAYAHTGIAIGNYEAEIGWGDEPPVVGFRNFIVFEFNEEIDGKDQGIKNAFKNLKAIAKFGGVTKELDVITESEPGHYSAKIIPTKTGTISVELRGSINNVPIDIQIPIEDVEDTAVLDFPPTSGSSSDQDIVSLKSALTSIQNDVTNLKGNLKENPTSNIDPQFTFGVGIIGIVAGTVAIVLAIFLMTKKERESKP